MVHRSKSKKRIDDEKENRRLSISPGKQQQPNIISKDNRSGTKSRSDKKRRFNKQNNPQAMSDAQLHTM